MVLKSLTVAAFSLALLQGAALAQSQSGTAAGKNTAQAAQPLPQEIKQRLQNQGYSEVKVVPGSYIISAKDKQGDPITAVIGPHSMTVFTMASPANGDASGSKMGSKSGGASAASDTSDKKP